MYSEHFKLLESKKHLEFILAKQTLNKNLLESPDFKDMTKWNLGCSKQSRLEDGNVLVCDSDNEQPCWAILSQKLNPEVIANQEVTISVKFQSYDDSLLNVCIRTKADSGEYNYILCNQFINESQISVSSLTGILPEESKLKDAHILVYLNKANARAKVAEVKLEIGNSSTLY